MGLLRPADWKARWIGADTQAHNGTAPIVIRRAIYEAVEGAGAADVTARLVRRMKGNRLSLTVNNATLGGDPAINRVKRLRFEYQCGGHTFERWRAKMRSCFCLIRGAVYCFRKTFEVKQPVAHAVLYVTALGLYEVHINGQRVGDHVLAPDWTDYRKRVRYQAYDVTSLVKPGDNAIAALLANGWFCGHIGNGGFQFFGTVPAFLAQLEVTYTDGRRTDRDRRHLEIARQPDSFFRFHAGRGL